MLACAANDAMMECMTKVWKVVGKTPSGKLVSAIANKGDVGTQLRYRHRQITVAPRGKPIFAFSRATAASMFCHYASRYASLDLYVYEARAKITKRRAVTGSLPLGTVFATQLKIVKRA